MKHQALRSTTQNMPRGFESLEPRHALDGATVPPLIQLSLPTTVGSAQSLIPAPASGASATTSQALPVLSMRVYTAPIGPLLASAKPATTAVNQTNITFPPITLAAFNQLGSAAAFPIGPARPANLPAPARSLYAEGYQTPKTPVVLTTEIQTMPIVTDAPGTRTPLGSQTWF